MITAMRHGRVSQPGSLQLPNREPSLTNKIKQKLNVGLALR